MCQHCNRSKQDDIGLDTVGDLTKNVLKNLKKDFKCDYWGVV